MVESINYEFDECIVQLAGFENDESEVSTDEDIIKEGAEELKTDGKLTVKKQRSRKKLDIYAGNSNHVKPLLERLIEGRKSQW